MLGCGHLGRGEFGERAESESAGWGLCFMGEDEDAGHSRARGRGEILFWCKGLDNKSWYAGWGIFQHVWYSDFVLLVWSGYPVVMKAPDRMII